MSQDLFNRINENHKSREDKNHPEKKSMCLENIDKESISTENKVFLETLGKDILVVVDAVQLNILGQVFRPIFTGRVVEVTNGHITLDPVIIKMNTAPFFKFPTPLSFPMESIVYFMPFDLKTNISIP